MEQADVSGQQFAKLDSFKDFVVGEGKLVVNRLRGDLRASQRALRQSCKTVKTSQEAVVNLTNQLHNLVEFRRAGHKAMGGYVTTKEAQLESILESQDRLNDVVHQQGIGKFGDAIMEFEREAASKRQITRDMELRRQEAESEDHLYHEHTKLLMIDNLNQKLELKGDDYHLALPSAGQPSPSQKLLHPSLTSC